MAMRLKTLKFSRRNDDGNGGMEKWKVGKMENLEHPYGIRAPYGSWKNGIEEN